jgi:hypothetical protein
MPLKLTAETVKGFTRYMLKAAFNGHGDEIAEFALVNLQR